jgi:superfamily II DNA or RNA helicase
MTTSTYQPGRLVSLRGRDWVVLPSDNTNVLVVKPLGAGDDEITSIFLPLHDAHDIPTDATFAPPSTEDIGDLRSSLLLYEAARLAFRNGAGPFRSLGKISFRPRSYQLVPLIMALRQERVRLLVADDVGVGKTIEALLIAREMLERRLIERFAIVCPPHLCEQWQDEIRTKLDIEAVVIRSNTQAALDREIQGDTSVFAYYRFQIISIDYIKSDTRRELFVLQAPDLVIVDEAHTATQAQGVGATQQQRHALLARLAEKPEQHLVLLTATPHSGKPEEFQSLLKLLRPEYATIDLATATDTQRRSIAKHFVQRKRGDVLQWLGTERPFPLRDAIEVRYPLSRAYAAWFDQLLEFTRTMVANDSGGKHQQRVRYWTALAMLRASISSPAAGAAVLTTRLTNLGVPEDGDSALFEDIPNPVGDSDAFLDSDAEPTELSEQTDWDDRQKRRLRDLRSSIEALAGPAHDSKVVQLAQHVNQLLAQGFHPVIFCRYILTAHYVGQHLPGLLTGPGAKGIEIAVVTSEDPDDVRRQRIATLSTSDKRLLIATDCLSEGINLQDAFSAVIHYDLPWNPNRIEQREGRIDRFGQQAPVVKTCLLYSDSDIDAIVLEVLIRKVREIRKATGVHVAFPADSQSIIDTITRSLLTNPTKRVRGGEQMQLFQEFPDVIAQHDAISHDLQAAADREARTRSMFAQHTITNADIEQDLKAVDEALGDPAAVERFVTTTLRDIWGMQVTQLDANTHRYRLNGTLPQALGALFGYRDGIHISFASPTPRGAVYLGRNHAMVEHLCQLVLAHTIERSPMRAARAAVIRTDAVQSRTVIAMLRCRNVIVPTNKKHQIVAEEMLLWGWSGTQAQRVWLDHSSAKTLLMTARPTQNLSPQSQAQFVTDALNDFATMDPHIDALATAQAERLVASHERFSTMMPSHRYQVVHPVLPMDVLGLYVLLPS